MTKPTILVATWSDGLFALTGDLRTQEIVNQPVTGLASDGKGGALAIVGRHSLCRRTPNGEWTTIAMSEFELSCCLAFKDAIYVGTDDASVLQLTPTSGALHAIESFGNVPGREAWFAGSTIVNGQRLGPPLGVRSLAANSNGSVLFVNVHVGGIPRSLDGGRTWQATIDINSDVHEVRAHPADPNIVAAASAIGLCISHDAGTTWMIDREGLHASHCSAVAFSGDDVLVSASKDPFAPEGCIYRRPLEPNGSLAAVQGGMPEWTDGIVDTGCIAAEGPYIAIAARGGTLYASDDFGRTWSCSSARLPSASGVLIL